jgi:hypothetical protein
MLRFSNEPWRKSQRRHPIIFSFLFLTRCSLLLASLSALLHGNPDHLHHNLPCRHTFLFPVIKKILLVEYAFPKRSLHKLRREITGPVFQLSCSDCWTRIGYKLSALIPLQFISYLYEQVVYSSTKHLHQPLSVLVISSGCPSAFQVAYFVFHFKRYSRQVNKLINTKLLED